VVAGTRLELTYGGSDQRSTSIVQVLTRLRRPGLASSSPMAVETATSHSPMAVGTETGLELAHGGHARLPREQQRAARYGRGQDKVATEVWPLRLPWTSGGMAAAMNGSVCILLVCRNV
jgi:hypothetical protein